MPRPDQPGAQAADGQADERERQEGASIPSTLKAWPDHVVLMGRTAGETQSAKGIPVTIVASRGGSYAPGTPREGYEYVQTYLTAVLADPRHGPPLHRSGAHQSPSAWPSDARARPACLDWCSEATRTVTPTSDTAGSERIVAGDKKAKAKAEQAKGKAKETVGRAVGNERLEAEGRTKQSKGDARQAKEKAKDVFKH
ncbi:hypothetical protein GCM10010320_70100 [Streptomyces caelestis]|nr:hypothetical protein GCM10010320_70100 [Streptomyces caelestis]